MVIQDLAGSYQVELMGDTRRYRAVLPGTLDENQIGYQDIGSNQWHPEDSLGEHNIQNVGLQMEGIITTRFTRKYCYEGQAIYSRTFTYRCKDNKRVFLEVERTRKLTTVLNGIILSALEPGTLSTPYRYEVTNWLQEENQLQFMVDNSYEGWPKESILYSSAATDETQTNWNGILGYLRLREERNNFISDIRVYPESTALQVVVEVNLREPYTGSISIHCDALEEEVLQDVQLEQGIHTITFSKLAYHESVMLWDEDEGNVYAVRVQGTSLEPKEIHTGIRIFSDDGEGHLCNNGHRIFLRCETNCCVFAETGHMPMTVEEWKGILLLYRDYGVNCLRFHSHCPPAAAFLAADQLGVFLQPELSHWNPKSAFESKESASYYTMELQQILKTYANHPSFVMLTLGNELHTKEAGQRVMDGLLETAKAYDSTRLYANGSNVFYGEKGTDEKSDFYTSCGYFEQMIRGTSAGMVGHLNQNTPNTRTEYSKVIEQIRTTYKKPVFSFEVGQYEVLPDFQEIAEFQGITVPHNLMAIQKRVEEAGLLSDWEQRVAATGELSLLAYREEVEAALRTKHLSGISLLGLQDFPGQGTALVGMLNSHLRPKPYAFAKPERFQQFFSSVRPLVLMEQYTYTNREVLQGEVVFANYGKETIQGTVLCQLWEGETLVEEVTLPTVSLPHSHLSSCGLFTMQLEWIREPKRLSLKVYVGQYTADYPVWVYPEEEVVIPKGILVTASFCEAIEALRQGDTVFFSPEATKERIPHSIQTNFTTDFWSVGTFSFQEGYMGILVDPNHPLFEHFPTEYHSNWQWWPLTNARAMILSQEQNNQLYNLMEAMDCYARLRRLSFGFECKVGSGKLLVSSLGLLEKQHTKEGKALFSSILKYMCSEQFQPEPTMSETQLIALFTSQLDKTLVTIQ